MKITANLKLGQSEYQFEIDEKDELEAMHKAIVMTNPKQKCNVCNNYERDKFRFDANKDKEGNTYIKVLCRGCGATSKLGSYKSGSYFWHDFEKYEKANTSTPTTQAKPKTGVAELDSNWA